MECLPIPQLHTIKFYAGQEVDQFDVRSLEIAFNSLSKMCTHETVQTGFGQNEVFDYTVIIIDKIMKTYKDNLFPVLKNAVKFIYNLSVNNSRNCAKLRLKFNYLKSWMSYNRNETVRNMICGIIYNISLDSDFVYEIIEIRLLRFVIESAEKSAEFPTILIEYLLRYNKENYDGYFMKTLFDGGDSHHLFLLKQLLDLVKRDMVCSYHIDFVKSLYRKKTEFIDKHTLDKTSLLEISTISNVLLSISVVDNKLSILQNDTNVLDVSILLLSYMTNKSKEPDSIFALSDDLNVQQDEVYNLKTNVVRLIGNLCWRNKIQQDRLREIFGIQLILDNCVRDMKNPFIVETIIFAIRNLCENNTENQETVRAHNKVISERDLALLRNPTD